MDRTRTKWIKTLRGPARVERTTVSFNADELQALSKQLGPLSKDSLVNWLMEVELSGKSRQYSLTYLVDLVEACMGYKDFAALPVKVRERSLADEHELRDALFELFFP